MTAVATQLFTPVINGAGGTATIASAATALTGKRLHLVMVFADKGSNAAMGAPTSFTQTGATWAQVGSAVAFGTSSRANLTVWRCQPSGNVSAAAITATFAGNFGRAVLLGVVTDEGAVDDDSANNGSNLLGTVATAIASGNVASHSVTIIQPAVGNPSFGFFAPRSGASVDIVAGTGFTNLSEATTNNGSTLNVGGMIELWDAGANGQPDTVVDASRAAGTNQWGALAFELKRLYVPGSVYYDSTPTTADGDAAAADHYGGTTDTYNELLLKMDPDGAASADAFANAWWGKNAADCVYEALVTERFIQLIRQSSKHLRMHPTGVAGRLTHIGGDMIDTWVAQHGGDSGRRYWTGGDNVVDGSNAVNLATNEFNDVATLIHRNHVTDEFLGSERDNFGVTRTADALGGGFRVRSSDNGTWLTPNQTDHPSTIYWTTCGCALPSGDLFAVGATLVLYPDPNPENALDHKIEDSHIIGITIFGTVSTTAKLQIPTSLDWSIAKIIRDTTYSYVKFRQAVPGYPNVLENLTTDTTYAFLARVLNTAGLYAVTKTGSVYDDYEFWDGQSWTSDISTITSAGRFKDIDGVDIPGDGGLGKLSDGSWIYAAQKFHEQKRRIYKSPNPQGPWTPIANVSTPMYGTPVVSGNNNLRTCIHTNIFPDWPAPAGYVMSMSNTMTFPPNGDAPDTIPTLDRHINSADTPYFILVPTHGQGSWGGRI